MKPRWIYEVVVTTRGDAEPNAAPIGVRTDDGKTIKADLYEGSSTLRNILLRKAFTVNFVPDPVMLHQALNHQDTLCFESAHAIDAPRLADVMAWLELKLLRQESAQGKVFIEAQIERAPQDGPVPLINRAAGLFLDSLVLSTRKHILPRRQLAEQFKENARVIGKVAPDSQYVEAMRDLMNSLTLDD